MNRTHVPEVKIIGQIQHAHLLATGITTRHFRNGIELPPIAVDPYYDVEVQEIRPVKPERNILPVKVDTFPMQAVQRTFRFATQFISSWTANWVTVRQV